MPKINTAGVIGAAIPAARLPSYQVAASGLLGLLHEAADELPFMPTLDDTEYKALVAVAPEVAAAIDDAAATVKTSFWSRRAVRNALAGLLFLTVVAAFVTTGFVPPPFNLILAGLLGASGLDAPSAYRWLAPPPDEADSPPERQDPPTD